MFRVCGKTWKVQGKVLEGGLVNSDFVGVIQYYYEICHMFLSNEPNGISHADLKHIPKYADLAGDNMHIPEL